MDTKITKEFLQEHFCKHDTLTLYKPDGTPVVITKQYDYAVTGGYHKYTFKDYESLEAFYKKHHLCLKPVIAIG